MHKMPRDPLPDHVAVFAAVEAGDAPAAQLAMARLVELALEDMAPSNSARAGGGRGEG
jgi:DNA-binding FadR family transcriptional regulator